MPTPVAVDGKLYVLGNMTGGANWPGTPESWFYELPRDKWTSITIPAAEARGGAVGDVYNKTV